VKALGWRQPERNGESRAGPHVDPIEARQAPQTLHVAKQEFERQYLRDVLAHSHGKRSEATKILGISRKNLWEKLRGDKPPN